MNRQLLIKKSNRSKENIIFTMIGNNIKKEKEFQSIKPIMKVLGYNAQEARDLLIESEKPDFILKYGNKTVGIEVTECHPEITEGKGAKNLMAAMQRTREICNFIEKLQDAKGEEVNYRLCFTFALLFDLQKSKLRRLEKERILGEVYAEMQNRIINGDFLVLGDDYQKLHKEWAKPYHYIRDIIIDKPLEKSTITYSYPNKGLFPIEHENIIKAISRKEAKFVSYQKNHPSIDDFWLCVNIPMGTNRTLYGLDGLTIETVYDRVYITDHKCVRLKINRR